MHYIEKIVHYIDTFASITSIITTLDKTESTERSKFQFEEGREEKEDDAPLRIAIDQLPTEQITIVVTNNRSGNVRHSPSSPSTNSASSIIPIREGGRSTIDAAGTTELDLETGNRARIRVTAWPQSRNSP